MVTPTLKREKGEAVEDFHARMDTARDEALIDGNASEFYGICLSQGYVLKSDTERELFERGELDTKYTNQAKQKTTYVVLQRRLPASANQREERRSLLKEILDDGNKTQDEDAHSPGDPDIDYASRKGADGAYFEAKRKKSRKRRNRR